MRTRYSSPVILSPDIYISLWNEGTAWPLPRHLISWLPIARVAQTNKLSLSNPSTQITLSLRTLQRFILRSYPHPQQREGGTAGLCEAEILLIPLYILHRPDVKDIPGAAILPGRKGDSDRSLYVFTVSGPIATQGLSISNGRPTLTSTSSNKLGSTTI